jgi:poly(A) polymerase
LQPNTSALFKKDKSFRSAYYKNIAAAHTENEQPLMRTFLYSMIAAYIEQETDWQLGTGDPTVCAGELYKTLFAKARQFVLPMNPPRLELERAIRRLFTEHNITVKKIRLNTLTGRRRNRRGGKGSKDPPNSFFYDE